MEGHFPAIVIPQKPLLPPQILDRLFGILYVRQKRQGHNDLLQCALVNKEWEELSLKHRFYEIKLTIGHGRWSASEFVRSKEYDRVRQLVGKLSLYWPQTPGTIRISFLEFLPHFPNLHSLVLMGLLNERIPWADASNANNCLAVKDLTIVGRPGKSTKYHHNPAALCDLLSMFGSLQNLTLKTFNDLHANSSAQKHLPWPPKEDVLWCPPEITSISLGGSYWKPVYDILGCAEIRSSVTSLTLSDMGPNYVSQSKRSPFDLIHTMTALEELDIPIGAAVCYFIDKERKTPTPAFLNLTEHHALRSLTIRSEASRLRERVLAAFLSTIPAESAPDSLTLDMTVDFKRDKNPTIFEETITENVDEILVLEGELVRLAKGGRLRHVKCRLLRFANPNEPKDLDFADNLPELREMGVLVVS